MDNSKRRESLELSAQELEVISGGMAEYTPVEYSTNDIYNGIVEKVEDKIPNPWGDNYTYYKEEKSSKEETFSVKPGGSPGS
jgi:hypothetical protein